jgi:glycosyltransferase involved in cell wall biosynthesis
LIVNQRFISSEKIDVYGFGAAGFALSAAKYLASEELLGGLILYRRDEALSSPLVRISLSLPFQSAELRFNFKMSTSALSDALSQAINLLRYNSDMLSLRHNSVSPILYHQSNTLLPFTPTSLPFFVTHHGPFAKEICRLFGKEFATDAFQGGEEKVNHLLNLQARGLTTLRDSERGIALEMSNVQEHILLQHGVSRTKIFRIAPPMIVAGAVSDLCVRSSQVDQNIELITAVARCDRFKNLDLLIDAANYLSKQGINLNLTIFAGSEDEEVYRHKFRLKLTDNLRSRTLIAPRLSHDNLLKYLRRHRYKGIFVCTSVYETFGITPFEAMLSEMVTIVPDEPLRIGVLEYLPHENRFRPTIEGLVSKLKELIETNSLISRSHQQSEQAIRGIDANSFSAVFRKATDYVLNCAPSTISLP